MSFRSSLNLYSLVFLIVWTCPAFADIGVPHIIFGKIYNSNASSSGKDNLNIYSYINTKPDEIMDKFSAGSGYEIIFNEGWFWVEAGNNTNLWKKNENLRIIVIDSLLNESNVIDLVLNDSGNQQLSDLFLISGDNAGPIASNALVEGVNSVSIHQGTSTINLTATVDDLLSGNNNIQNSEYFIDTDPGPGFGVPLDAVDAFFDSPSETIQGSVDTSQWEKGLTYTIYLRGQDSANNWGTTHRAYVAVVEPLIGDIDIDGDVDRNDINIILAARNTSAQGANDPRDVDGDGMITVNDVRKATLLCTRYRCAVR